MARWAGFDPDKALIAVRTLEATPQTQDAIGAPDPGHLPDQPAIRNLLHGVLETVVENGNSKAVQDAELGRILEHLPWLLQDPTKDPKLAGQIAEIEMLVARVLENPHAANRREIIDKLTDLMLSVLLVSGHIMAGQDAYASAIAAYEAFQRGDTAEGLMKSLEVIVDGTGAVPGVGDTVRFGRGVLRVGRWFFGVLTARRRAGGSSGSRLNMVASGGSGSGRDQGPSDPDGVREQPEGLLSNEKASKGLEPHPHDVEVARIRRSVGELEEEILAEARAIAEHPDFTKLRKAFETGREDVVVTINGRQIRYVPELNASGMSDLQTDGFFIGPDAFTKSADEWKKTILQELHRLHFGNLSGANSGEFAEVATDSAVDFVERFIGRMDQ